MISSREAKVEWFTGTVVLFVCVYLVGSSRVESSRLLLLGCFVVIVIFLIVSLTALSCLLLDSLDTIHALDADRITLLYY